MGNKETEAERVRRMGEGKLCERGRNCKPCFHCEDRSWCAHFDALIHHEMLCDDCPGKKACIEGLIE